MSIEKRLFEQSSRYLVLFLTLRYDDAYRDDVTLRTIQRHRDIFMRRIDGAQDGVLGKIQACIWKLEEGQEAGLHLHCLLFFSGRHRADTYYAERIGDYWVDIVTRGWGDYWNSNTDKQKAKHERRYGSCLGQVDAADEGKRSILRRFASEYLTKQTQVPTDRGDRDRTWGVRFFS
ncbi:hypothetical protein [Castellaniella sp.]|uniref:hypothetical protein n=1 Tax=Castellaniella sp. TaxID=1955812 RepID=UPI002AFF1C41|nr:hypothetical protein [Castellaniella sp.]